MNNTYGFFVIIVLIFALIIYLVFNGPNLALFLQNEAIDSSVTAGTSTISVEIKPPAGSKIAGFRPGPPSPYYSKNYGNKSSQAGTIVAKPDNTPLNITPPSGFTRDQISPLYDKVRITGLSFPSSLNSYSRVALTSNAAEPINVTGWKIRGKRIQLPDLPSAINDYQAIGVSEKTGIILNKSETVGIYSSRSPIGQNIRLNKCTGYLNNYYNFYPALPKSCPRLDKSEIFLYSSACQSFIRTFSGCRVPTANQLNYFTNPDENACHTFLSEINYGGCYQKHRADPDFFSREWRVWLNYDFAFDRQHDRLLLFDENNLLVDEYIY